MKKNLSLILSLRLWLIAIAVIILVTFNVQKLKNDSFIDSSISESSEIVNFSNESEKDKFEADIEKANLEETAKSDESVKPTSILISVPFISQAPFQVWDALHEDACEEVSFLMVRHFLENTKINSLEDEERGLKKMIEYEKKNGYGLSITLKELNQIAKDFFQIYSGRVKTSINIDDIKEELINGRPVIVPAAGKVLTNPNFRNGGPNYHMLVIVGFDENGFISNDPGTRKGENFRYTFNGLFNAIHDWDPENILNGQKAYLVFEE